MSLDLEQHLKRQMAFSRGTYGPGERRAGVIDHVKKELEEIKAATDLREAAEEWVDVVILALDGMTRALTAYGFGWDMIPGVVVDMIEHKQSRNEQRDWPDWRTAPKDRAIEHVRDREVVTE